MAMNINDYITRQIIAYLDEYDETVRKLTERINHLEHMYVEKDSYLCTVCNQYAKKHIRCRNWSNGCTFHICYECEDYLFNVNVHGRPPTFIPYHDAYPDWAARFDPDYYICTEKCHNKYNPPQEG